MRDPYATHIRPLKALLAAEKPKRVLEYGGGPYSTGIFLSCDHVELVVTVETDPDWRGLLSDMYETRRHRVLSSGTPNAQDFDLIFIDNGTTARERVHTIRSVLSKPHPTVVIHDAEVEEYAKAIAGHPATVFPTRPDTAVITATKQ